MTDPADLVVVLKLLVCVQGGYPLGAVGEADKTVPFLLQKEVTVRHRKLVKLTRRSRRLHGVTVITPGEIKEMLVSMAARYI